MTLHQFEQGVQLRLINAAEEGFDYTFGYGEVHSESVDDMVLEGFFGIVEVGIPFRRGGIEKTLSKGF